MLSQLKQDEVCKHSTTMPQKNRIRSRSRLSKIPGRTQFLLVLLILPILPEKSEQYQKVFQVLPPRPEPVIQNGYSLPSQSYYSNQWHPNGYRKPLKPANGISGIVTLRQVPSLPKQPMKQLSPYPFHRPSKILSYPTPPPKKLEMCRGRKHILDDIGILSLVTAITASFFGFYTILVNSMTSNNIGLVSSFLGIVIWLPSTLISLYNLSGDLITFIGNFLNGLSFINTLYGLIGVVFGTADVLASVAGETIGILSLILSVIATFPEYLDEIIEYLYRTAGRKNRRRLEHYIENYGCSEDVPGVLKWAGRPIYDIVNMFLVDTTKQKGTSLSYRNLV